MQNCASFFLVMALVAFVHSAASYPEFLISKKILKGALRVKTCFKILQQ